MTELTKCAHVRTKTRHARMANERQHWETPGPEYLPLYGPKD